MKISLNLTVETPGERLDVFLHTAMGWSRTLLQERIHAGNVKVNAQTVTKPSHKLRAGDLITGMLIEEETLALEPVAHDLDILFEDEYLLCLNKPQNMVVHPASGYNGPTLVHHLLYYFRNNPGFKSLGEGRPGIVHRLDRGTSGVLLIAKDRKTQDLLSQLFKKRLIQKEYEAIVWGKAPAKARYESMIGRDRKDRKKMSSHCEKGRTALTEMKLFLTSAHFSHVALFPKTGRTHQLRVHLSENRLPIVGDLLYGPKRIENRASGLNPDLQAAVVNTNLTLLHAKRLTFQHPISKKELVLEAPRPEAFDKFLGLMKSSDL